MPRPGGGRRPLIAGPVEGAPAEEPVGVPAQSDDLTALFVNCTLKRSPEVSNTQGLVDRSVGILEHQGVRVDQFRAIDHDIATGVWPDMTEHGWATDAWPELYRRVLAADILVLAGPIWLGDNGSVTSTWATRSRRRPTPAGSVRRGPARPTSTRAPAGRRTTSPTGTRRS
jgi:hypothetical protein